MAEVIGHEKILKLLELWKDKPAFAYLFVGPAHLGKSLVAEKFVRELVSDESQVTSYKLQELRLHPDIILFEPEEGKKELSVKIVREQRNRLYSRPQISKRTVAFLPYMDKMNDEGFNALLKVMEEPPAEAVFVCVAENISRIPATILSRMVKINMSLVPQIQIEQALIAQGMSAVEAHKKSILARGRPGLASIEQSSSTEFIEAAQDFVNGPSLGHRFAASEALSKLCDSTEDASAAWAEALSACGTALRSKFLSDTKLALILGQGIADATGAIGSALNPRLMLDAAAINADQAFLKLPNFYPKTFVLTLQL
ncbi:MAG: AAA family ATPase [Patescibacteria group bacterium]|jgi:hypothetical protein